MPGIFFEESNVFMINAVSFHLNNKDPGHNTLTENLQRIFGQIYSCGFFPIFNISP